MFCPKCNNELDLFADKCLSCGMSFKNMSLAERQKFNGKPVIPKRKNIPRKLKRKVNSFRKDELKSPKTNTTTRFEYHNGYAS